MKLSFFGGLKLNRVHEPDVAADNRIQVASLVDVAATELTTIQQRAQARHYEDLCAIVCSGISLADALAAAGAVYGQEFNGALSLKALTYFADGDLPGLSAATQKKLRTLASEINLKQIPRLQAIVGLTAEEGVQR